MPNSSPAVMKQFHDLSFLATWAGKERWTDIQWAGCVSIAQCVQNSDKSSSCPSIWLNRAPRRHMGERRYRWHTYSLLWSASRPSRFIPDTHRTVGWVASRARFDTWGEKALIHSAGGPTCLPVTVSTELSWIQKFGTYGIEHNCLGLFQQGR